MSSVGEISLCTRQYCCCDQYPISPMYEHRDTSRPACTSKLTNASHWFGRVGNTNNSTRCYIRSRMFPLFSGTCCADGSVVKTRNCGHSCCRQYQRSMYILSSSSDKHDAVHIGHVCNQTFPYSFHAFGRKTPLSLCETASNNVRIYSCNIFHGDFVSYCTCRSVNRVPISTLFYVRCAERAIYLSVRFCIFMFACVCVCTIWQGNSKKKQYPLRSLSLFLHLSLPQLRQLLCCCRYCRTYSL